MTKLIGKKLLLMGSKAFKVKRLPTSLAKRINDAIARKMKIIVGEVPGSCWLFQNYLQSKKYKNVTVGHAKSIRYNAGNWKTKQYGDNVPEREKNLIKECDSAIIIWADHSGVIAENLEFIKRLGKPTLVYEYSNKTRKGKADWLDPNRVYDAYYNWKEYHRRQKRMKKQRRVCKTSMRKRK